MVMEQLTCIDPEVLGSCSTGALYGRARLSPLQRTSRASTDSFSVLKKMQLAETFTMAKNYKIFASTLCTKCGEFGGYVFLPSFTRCYIHCAETELAFLPITANAAMN